MTLSQSSICSKNNPLLFLSFLIVMPVMAASSSPSNEVLSKEQSIQKIERRLEQLEQKMVHSDQDGFMIQSATGDNQLWFHLLLQTDQDIFMDTQGVTLNSGTSSLPITDRNTVDRLWVRRARPTLSGTLLKYYDFTLSPDFGQGQSRLYDAYVDDHYFDKFSFKVGKQISLISGLDILKSPNSLYSMEAGYSGMMAPNREIGLVFHGEWTSPGLKHQSSDSFGFNDLFSYQIGMFSGTADNSNPGLNPVSSTAFSTETATLENKSLEARVFANPFQGSNIALIEGLGIGVSGSSDDPNNETELPAMISVGQNPIFTYMSSTAANGARHRIHPQACWYLGAFAVLGDWAQTMQTLSSTVQPNTSGQLNTYITQNNQAGQVQLIYNVTGEKGDFLTKLTPNKPFDPLGSGTWGAIQFVGRWSGLYMNKRVFRASTTNGSQTLYTFSDPRLSVSEANTLSVGVNWFLNRYVRMTTEYDQTRFVGGCSTGALTASINPGCLTSGTAATASTSMVLNRPDEKVIMQRFQLQF